MFEENEDYGPDQSLIFNFPKCEKCVVILSDILDSLMKHIIYEQYSIYSITDKYSFSEFNYTNKFNIVIDAFMRLTFKFSELMTRIVDLFHPRIFIIFDNITGKLNSISDSQYTSMENKKQFLIPYVNSKTNLTSLQLKLMSSFKELSQYLYCDEEEDFLPIEEYLVQSIPKYYSFSLKDIIAKKSNKFQTEPDFKINQYIAKRRFIESVVFLQTTLAEKEKDAIKELFVYNLKLNNKHSFKIISTKLDVNYNLIYSLFPDEKIIYVSNKTVSRRNMFFFADNKFRYPFIPELRNTFIPFDRSMETLFQSIIETTTKRKIKTIIKLLKLCQDESKFGIFDINGDFRYNYFDDVKSLIVDKHINFIKPDKLIDNEIGWIGINEYIEEIPNWIHQFNSFSNIKILVNIE